MEEIDSFYVIETSDELYLVEDEIYDGKVVEGILELATRFQSNESAQEFLIEMKEAEIQGKIKKAKTYISVVEEK